MAKPKSKIIKELLEQGKTVQEIHDETEIKIGYINAVKKKKEKVE